MEMLSFSSPSFFRHPVKTAQFSYGLRQVAPLTLRKCFSEKVIPPTHHFPPTSSMVNAKGRSAFDFSFFSPLSNTTLPHNPVPHPLRTVPSPEGIFSYLLEDSCQSFCFWFDPLPPRSIDRRIMVSCFNVSKFLVSRMQVPGSSISFCFSLLGPANSQCCYRPSL